MTEYQRETAFLRRIILFDDTNERRKLEERMAQVQNDQRRVERVALAIALFFALGLAILIYGMLLNENFLDGNSAFTIKLMCQVGLASLLSLATFVGLLMIYRQKLNGLREECRELVINFMESRLQKAHVSLADRSHQAVPKVAAEDVKPS